MEQISFKSITNKLGHPTRSDFKFDYVVGKGGFSKVWRAVHKSTNFEVAIKEMSKKDLISENMLNSVLREKQVLSQIYHSFLANMLCSFQDKESLYIVLQYIPNNDLRTNCSSTSFGEDEIKFIAANLLIAFDYLHSNNLIHCDIKPENLIFDEKGYWRVTDFGIVQRITKKAGHERCGTPGYICPEMLNKNSVLGREVDYFSLGVIWYELMFRKRPFKGTNKMEIIEEFNRKNVEISSSEMKGIYSEEICDWVNGWLRKNNEKRIGYSKGFKEVMNHPWFKGYDWKGIINKTYQSPFSKLNEEMNKRKIYNKINNIFKYTQETSTNINSGKSGEKIATKDEKLFNNFTIIHLIKEKEKENNLVELRNSDETHPTSFCIKKNSSVKKLYLTKTTEGKKLVLNSKQNTSSDIIPQKLFRSTSTSNVKCFKLKNQRSTSDHKYSQLPKINEQPAKREKEENLFYSVLSNRKNSLFNGSIMSKLISHYGNKFMMFHNKKPSNNANDRNVNIVFGKGNKKLIKSDSVSIFKASQN